jgi:hypothetical protein
VGELSTNIQQTSKDQFRPSAAWSARNGARWASSPTPEPAHCTPCWKVRLLSDDKRESRNSKHSLSSCKCVITHQQKLSNSYRVLFPTVNWHGNMCCCITEFTPKSSSTPSKLSSVFRTLFFERQCNSCKPVSHLFKVYSYLVPFHVFDTIVCECQYKTKKSLEFP